MQTISILIIDDSETDRYLIKRSLNKLNLEFHISEVENGVEALTFLDNYDKQKLELGDLFPPILIFLDINMPCMDGFEFLEHYAELKKQEEGYDTSVFVMFTSSDQEEDKERIVKYAFVKDYLVKNDISADKLNEIITKHLNLHK